MNKSIAAKKLKDLLPVVDSVAGGIVVARLQLDSRLVTDGDLFIALPGYKVDGREFVFDALKKGAAAVLAESSGYSASQMAAYPANVIWINSLKDRLGVIADRFFDSPSRALRVIAVTGTNGKTTVAHVTARVCASLGEKAATIGTLGYGHPDHLVDLGNTTPDVVTVHRILRELSDNGCHTVVMEASSHGLDQGRLNDVVISTAIATNLTRDHLDYHHTMDAYFQAKARIAQWPGLKHLILNDDDEWIRQMAVAAPQHVRVVRFSLQANSHAEVRLVHCDYLPQGIVMDIVVGDQSLTIHSHLMGEFNVANILAVTAALWVEGFALTDVASALAELKPVSGRMESLLIDHIGNAPTVVVDYAHTPDALMQALNALRKHCKEQRLWCVFGCGGNRDKGKRPLMGQIAAQLADQVVVTTDNPRDENPDDIINEICVGIAAQDQISVIGDRATAIQFAIASAGPGDVVLLAGKGHENYQEIAGQRFFFSDHEVAMSALKNLATPARASV